MKKVKEFYQSREFEVYDLHTESRTIRCILKEDLKQMEGNLWNMENKIEYGKTDENTYYLSAVINHSGNAECGHYYSFIKVNDEWFQFDDSRITIKTEKEVLEVSQGKTKHPSNCYCLFYSKSNNLKKINYRKI